MRQRNPSIRPLFGVIIVLALAYNDWTLYQKLINLRYLETGAQARMRFERQISAMNHQADLWEAKADALTAKSAPGAKAAGAKAGTGQSGPGDPQQLAQAVRSELIAAWIDRVYGPFFKQLALSAPDLARFKGLITDKRQAILDAIDAAHAQGITDPAGLRDAILQAVTAPNASIQALLGDANYDAFRAYQASLPARSTMADLTAALPPDASLTPEQSDALTKIIAQGQAPSTRAASVVENLLTNVPAPVNQKDLAAAASILNPAQLSALQSLRNQAAIQRDLLRLLYP